MKEEGKQEEKHDVRDFFEGNRVYGGVTFFSTWSRRGQTFFFLLAFKVMPRNGWRR